MHKHLTVAANLQQRLSDHIGIWSGCTRCGLCHLSRRRVLLRGCVPAQLLFIGEAPGESEDALGVPFIGEAGRFQDQLLSAFISHEVTRCFTNVVACWPRLEEGGWRKPNRTEMDACWPRLLELLDIVNPSAVVAVGEVSARQLLPRWERKLADAGKEFVTVPHPSRLLHLREENWGLYEVERERYRLAMERVVEAL